MERTNLGNSFDFEQQKIIGHILDNAAQVIDMTDSLDSAPTTAGGELKEGQIAYYSGELFIQIQGVTRKITLTSV